MSSFSVTYRTGTEIATCNSSGGSIVPEPFFRPGNYRQIINSRFGDYVACISPEGLNVIDPRTNAEIYSYIQKGIVEVSVSPNGTYVCTWERQLRTNNGEQPHLNLLVHNVVTKTVFARHSHKNQSNWAPQWSDDESVYGRLTGPCVVTFTIAQGPTAGSAVTLRNEKPIADFSLSPGKNPYVVIFVPEDKRLSTPALVKLYMLVNITVPVSNKTFFKADKVRFLWNQVGTAVLVLTQTDVDTTGQSYYGENNLYYLSVKGNYDCRVALAKKGPVHDVAWAPCGREFAVSYGFMPSETMLFNQKADPVFDFGVAPRNTLVFSPNGRILVVGGFGNLQGDFELWDLAKSTKLASVSSPNATHLTWSPDGRFLLTATLSPRLRVDNGWKIWHYQGICVARQDVKELFQIEWLANGPCDLNFDSWAARDLSPAPLGIQGKGAPKSKTESGGAYRPPSARGGSGVKTVPGANFGPAPISRGRGASGSAVVGYTKPVKQNGRGQVSPPQVPELELPVAHANGKQHTPPLSLAEKRVQTLTKKLKQIQGLKTKQSTGEHLDGAQLRKMASENEIRTELAALGLVQQQL